MIQETQILEALKGVNDPELGKSLVELGMVHDVEVDGDCVSFTLALTTLACPLLSFSDHHTREEEILARVTGGGLFRLSSKGRKTYSFLKEG